MYLMIVSHYQQTSNSRWSSYCRNVLVVQLSRSAVVFRKRAYVACFRDSGTTRGRRSVARNNTSGRSPQYEILMDKRYRNRSEDRRTVPQDMTAVTSFIVYRPTVRRLIKRTVSMGYVSERAGRDCACAFVARSQQTTA
jgi:hypothetical protein